MYINFLARFIFWCCRNGKDTGVRISNRNNLNIQEGSPPQGLSEARRGRDFF
jgi:hypothetical protein